MYKYVSSNVRVIVSFRAHVLQSVASLCTFRRASVSSDGAVGGGLFLGQFTAFGESRSWRAVAFRFPNADYANTTGKRTTKRATTDYVPVETRRSRTEHRL